MATYNESGYTYDKPFVEYDGDSRPLIVGAPVSGKITALDSYCGGGPHTDPQLSYPTDLGNSVPNGTLLTFFSDPEVVKSTVVTHTAGGCSCGTASPYTDGVKVEMKDVNSASLGFVHYLHVVNRVTVGKYNAAELDVGTVPGGSHCCYIGDHSHSSTSGTRISGLTCSPVVWLTYGDPFFTNGG